MELTPYIHSVRAGLRDGAALADEHTRQVVEKIGDTVESSTRLALLHAITDATAEISTELAPGSVEVRMNGNDPTFVVSLPDPADDEVTDLTTEIPQVPPVTDDTEPTEELSVDEDEPQARVSLRIPQSVKERVDALADAEGVSTNTWILHRILESIALRQSGDVGEHIKQQVLGALGVQLGDLGGQLGREWRRANRDIRREARRGSRGGGATFFGEGTLDERNKAWPTPPGPPAPPGPPPGFDPFAGRSHRGTVRGWVK